MKTIGLIGGMSWESSKVYYEWINRTVNEELGGSHSAKSIMISVDFAEIERLTFAGDWNKIGDLMTNATSQLERGGADLVVLCTNTIHLVSNFITDSSKVPFLHIADATGRAIKEKSIEKVGLLGTRFTMEKDFYSQTLKENHDIETIIPSESSCQIVHDIIYDELVKGVIKRESRDACKKILDELESLGVEGIILGCTELPLLISFEDSSIPLFDTTKIHAREAVKYALGEVEL
ncbi:MAG: aspartate/glutamate racemase family protein [Bacteroidota bacterium]